MCSIAEVVVCEAPLMRDESRHGHRNEAVVQVVRTAVGGLESVRALPDTRLAAILPARPWLPYRSSAPIHTPR